MQFCSANASLSPLSHNLCLLHSCRFYFVCGIAGPITLKREKSDNFYLHLYIQSYHIRCISHVLTSHNLTIILEAVIILVSNCVNMNTHENCLVGGFIWLVYRMKDIPMCHGYESELSCDTFLNKIDAWFTWDQSNIFKSNPTCWRHRKAQQLFDCS